MKAKCSSENAHLDRISLLPQTITEIILCLLPIEEAARTSILSREWRYKWTTIPKLAFDDNIVYNWRPSNIYQQSDLTQTSCMANARKNMDWRCKLFYAIHQVLLMRQSPILEFTLSSGSDDNCFEIDQIIFHLSRNHNVKKLTLQLPWYDIPLCVFSLHHLKDLCLKECNIFHEPTFSGFGSLTSLSFEHVTISVKSLLHLLSNCPSLKRLSLLYGEDLLDETATISELFKCLPAIEDLTIGSCLIPVLCQASVSQELPTSLIHLKYVCIHKMVSSDDVELTFLFLVILMKCSPNLEKIKLQLEPEDEDDDEYEPCVLERFSDIQLEHLNELEINGFESSKREMKLVKFILARSPNLKRMMLRTWTVDKAEQLEMLKVLLCIPRASPVEIIIKGMFGKTSG